jgi:hypothetical protein
MKLVRFLGVSANLLPHRRDVRFPAKELDATYSTNTRQKSVRIKDLSPTGIYLFTDDRWAPGAGVPLTLRKWSIQERSPLSSLRIHASVIRHGPDGVALEFFHGASIASAWSNLVSTVNPAPLTDKLRMLRLTRALAFLCRLSPSREAESLKLVHNELAFESGERAIEILLTAEELVIRRGFESRPEISQDLIFQILQDGSQISEAWIRRFWAGLLAAAIPKDADDFKTLAYAGLLSKLDSVQLRILTASCTRAGYTWDKEGVIAPQRHLCSAEDMRRITRTSDLIQIERCLDHLYQLGLVEKTVKTDPFSPIGEANLTPTRAGLALYAECNGWPERARASELAKSTELASGEVAPESELDHSQDSSIATDPNW